MEPKVVVVEKSDEVAGSSANADIACFAAADRGGKGEDAEARVVDGGERLFRAAGHFFRPVDDHLDFERRMGLREGAADGSDGHRRAIARGNNDRNGFAGMKGAVHSPVEGVLGKA